MSLLTFTSKGIYCKPGDFYIDPWLPVPYAIITHGHADHARWGSEHYLCHTYTKPILKLRLGADVHVTTLPYAETFNKNGVTISLHPAGHIIGSSQIRLEYKGEVAVVSGDYKTGYDGISHEFEPVRCHEFVTESTFGLPIYNWKTDEQIVEDISRWIQNNQAQDKTSVFLAYSLGKSQRLMKGLEKVAPIFVHSAVHNINEAIKTTGIVLPHTEILTAETDKELVKKNIVIAPPALLGTNWIKKIPRAAVAICSGWMQVRGSRRWQAVDAGFAMSDHADWQGLLDAIKATGAQKVYVTHGSTAAFSKYLNEIGIESEEVRTQYGKEEEDEKMPEAITEINVNN